jgi:hypothetical protein
MEKQTSTLAARQKNPSLVAAEVTRLHSFQILDFGFRIFQFEPAMERVPPPR